MRSADRRILLSLALAGALYGYSGMDKDEEWVAGRKNWWAFRKPVRTSPPASGGDAWIRTPVDAFVRAAQRQKGLTPSPEPPREALLRRVYLDLTGLPPTPAQAGQFLADRAPDAYERLVDRLLASPHYGERWATKWLDVVRYADTNGYEADAERPHAWRYRDWVVNAFNSDKPFDRFILEQIAGDELFPGDAAALIATGFHRAGPVHVVGGNQDVEMNRQEVLTEMTSAIGSTFLGLTIGCARCHNHKFDPIPQSDYYRLQAIFAATEGKDIPLASEDERRAYEKAKERHQARLKPVRDAIAAIEQPYRERLRAAKIEKLDPELAAALRVPKEKRTESEKRLAKDAEGQIKVSWDELVASLSEADRDRRAALRRQMHDIEYEAPEPPAAAFAVANADPSKPAPDTYILKVGNHKMKLDKVGPGLLRALDPPPVGEEAVGRRSALARWLASPGNPLTARVMVNRIWQLRMGQGLVATPNDYGLLGSRPALPQLLDWLAAEFVASGWSVKKMDRLILTSSAYRQTVAHDAAKAAIDPDNRFHWRANRRRLEAEFLRDSVLAAAGTLNPRLGGRPVRVPIEREIYDLIFTEGEPDNLWPVTREAGAHTRRSLYLLNKRTVRLPMLANFDQPDAMTSCPTRPNSTHALQALSLMNSEFMQQQAEAFAAQISRECGAAGRDCQIHAAFTRALARKPKPAEVRWTREYLAGGNRLADFCLVMFNRNEFAYLP